MRPALSEAFRWLKANDIAQIYCKYLLPWDLQGVSCYLPPQKNRTIHWRNFTYLPNLQLYLWAANTQAFTYFSKPSRCLCDSGLGGLRGIRKWTLECISYFQLWNRQIIFLVTSWNYTNVSLHPVHLTFSLFHPTTCGCFFSTAEERFSFHPAANLWWFGRPCEWHCLRSDCHPKRIFELTGGILWNKQSIVTIVIHTKFTNWTFLPSQVPSFQSYFLAAEGNWDGIFRRILWQKTRVLKLPFEGCAI